MGIRKKTKQVIIVRREVPKQDGTVAAAADTTMREVNPRSGNGIQVGQSAVVSINQQTMGMENTAALVAPSLDQAILDNDNVNDDHDDLEMQAAIPKPTGTALELVYQGGSSTSRLSSVDTSISNEISVNDDWLSETPIQANSTGQVSNIPSAPENGLVGGNSSDDPTELSADEELDLLGIGTLFEDTDEVVYPEVCNLFL